MVNGKVPLPGVKVRALEALSPSSQHAFYVQCAKAHKNWQAPYFAWLRALHVTTWVAVCMQVPRLTSELLSGVPDAAADAATAAMEEMDAREEYYQYMLCRLADVGVVSASPCARQLASEPICHGFHTPRWHEP